jgi:hypothetical protein
MNERSALIRRNRWTVLDDCPGYDEVLLAPPARTEEAA